MFGGLQLAYRDDLVSALRGIRAHKGPFSCSAAGLGLVLISLHLSSICRSTEGTRYYCFRPDTMVYDTLRPPDLPIGLDCLQIGNRIYSCTSYFLF